MEINTKELKEKIDNGEQVMVAFTASWCQPCKMYKPIFQKLSENTDVPMYLMDVEQNSNYVIELGVRAVPTTKMFNNGGEVYSKSGIISESELKNIING